MATVNYKDYQKFHHKRLGKVYFAHISFDGKDRILSRWTRTATASVEYGRRVAERYNRIFGNG